MLHCLHSEARIKINHRQQYPSEKKKSILKTQKKKPNSNFQKKNSLITKSPKLVKPIYLHLLYHELHKEKYPNGIQIDKSKNKYSGCL